MIVCVVDDLIFSIKISTAAKSLKADVYFERSGDRLLATIRDKRPSLVIFDLNSGKTDPINTISALKADPELAALRTIGFASHVHTELISAARKAGADQVLPRSAFAGNLAEILLSSQSPTP